MSVSLRGWRGGGRHRNPSYDDVISLENLFAAWRAFAKGKRGRADVMVFERNLEDHLFDLHDRLVCGEWVHGSYETFTVCDPKPRVIHKASVEDRVVHHAIVRMIEPLFDRSFIFDSWSCRRGKGTHASVVRLQSQLRRMAQQTHGSIWVLKADIRKFFQTIDQQVLMELVKKKLVDTKLVGLIGRIVKSHPLGLPLGNLTSQLFANVYLDPFDHFVKESLRAPVYLRYCDDFILVHPNRSWLLERLVDVRIFLRDTMHLELHPNKTSVRPSHLGIDWLGHVVYPDRVMLRASTRRRMEKRVDAVVREHLDGCRCDVLMRSIFASYHGLLHSTDEGDLKCFYSTLYDCL